MFVSNSVSLFFHVCCPVFARLKKTLTPSRMFFVEDEILDTLKASCFDLVMLGASSMWSAIVGDFPFRMLTRAQHCVVAFNKKQHRLNRRIHQFCHGLY